MVMWLHTGVTWSLMILFYWLYMGRLVTGSIRLAKSWFSENLIGLKCPRHCVWVVVIVVSSFLWVNVGLWSIQLWDPNFWAHLWNMHLRLLILTNCIKGTRPDLDSRLSPILFVLFSFLRRAYRDLCQRIKHAFASSSDHGLSMLFTLGSGRIQYVDWFLSWGIEFWYCNWWHLLLRIAIFVVIRLLICLMHPHSTTGVEAHTFKVVRGRSSWKKLLVFDSWLNLRPLE